MSTQSRHPVQQPDAGRFRGLVLIRRFRVAALSASIAAAGLAAWPVMASDAPGDASAESSEGDRGDVEVIYAGFVRRADKGARVFVQLTGEVPVALDRSGQRLTYRLDGAKLTGRNNANPLPTQFFASPVSHVALVETAGGVDLVIDLRSDGNSEPTHRLVENGKLATLHVELPPSE